MGAFAYRERSDTAEYKFFNIRLADIKSVSSIRPQSTLTLEDFSEERMKATCRENMKWLFLAIIFFSSVSSVPMRIANAQTVGMSANCGYFTLPDIPYGNCAYINTEMVNGRLLPSHNFKKTGAGFGVDKDGNAQIHATLMGFSDDGKLIGGIPGIYEFSFKKAAIVPSRYGDSVTIEIQCVKRDEQCIKLTSGKEVYNTPSFTLDVELDSAEKTARSLLRLSDYFCADFGKC